MRLGTDFEVTIPDGMATGVYGVRLRCGGEQDIVPFYVLPPAGVATAPLVFLASTFTYQIYGNHRRGNVDEAFRARQAEWGAYPWNAQDCTRNTAPRPTTRTPTAAASAIRASAGRC